MKAINIGAEVYDRHKTRFATRSRGEQSKLPMPDVLVTLSRH